jgi:type II secretory pathway pseudopilin PulG
MMHRKLRNGFSLIETVLFLGILSIMSGTIVAVYIATQEARIRQRSVAELEQSGTALLETMTKNIRRAEKVLAPATNTTGSILSLQMAGNGEFPTIFALNPLGNLTHVQKTSTSGLLTSRVTISKLSFRNVSDTNVTYSFDLTITVPTVVPQPYVRTFGATVTLFPDDQSDAGGTCAESVTTIAC